MQRCSSDLHERKSSGCRDKAAELVDVKSEISTLRDTLAMQQSTKDGLQRDVGRLSKDLRSTSTKLEERDKELASQKQVTCPISVLSKDEWRQAIPDPDSKVGAIVEPCHRTAGGVEP
jgi:septal ring factor EnvC (AmiA/AmiB activator)